MNTARPSVNISVSGITSREKQILELIAFEYTSDMIERELYISHHTVVSHRKNLLDKLQVRNVADLIRRSFELGLLGAGTEYRDAAWMLL